METIRFDELELNPKILRGIKDMEIRLSQAITANPIQFTAHVEMPKQTLSLIHI